jgi:transcriptional regulator with XRE-family HTH domain
MARMALEWHISDLAEKSQIGTATIGRFESGKGVNTSTLSALTKAFVEHGIKFIADDEASLEGGPGVRLKK